MTTGRSQAHAGSRKGCLSPSQGSQPRPGSLDKGDEELRHKNRSPVSSGRCGELILTAGRTESKMTLIC